MSETIVEAVRSVISNDYLATMIIAFLPIIELRGAIPVGVAMGMSPWIALIFAYIGSTLAAPILLLLLKPILNLLKKIKIFNELAIAIEDIFNEKADQIIKKVEEKGKTNDHNIAEKIKLLGVFCFVAIPVPLTGVWTGTAIASFLNLPFWKGLAVVMLGNLIAGIIMTFISIVLAKYIEIIIGVFVFIVIIVFAIFIYKVIKKIIENKKSSNKTDNN